jgi:hypothetical protein
MEKFVFILFLGFLLFLMVGYGCGVVEGGGWVI